MKVACEKMGLTLQKNVKIVFNKIVINNQTLSC